VIQDLHLQSGIVVSRHQAIEALLNHQGDPVEAILELEGCIDSAGENLMMQ
jgi:hypothetical protein